jgi:hypothetical protein
MIPLKFKFNFFKQIILSLVFLILFFLILPKDAKNIDSNSCKDIQHLRNDSFFFIEGKGAWQTVLNERRDDLRRMAINPFFISRKGDSENYVYQGFPREGTITFKGTYISQITVIFPYPYMISEPSEIFYYSCRGFFYPEMIKSKSHINYLKQLYNSKSYFTGDWLYFPYIGIAFHFKKKKAVAFRIFKPTKLSEGFRYKKYYRQKIY